MKLTRAQFHLAALACLAAVVGGCSSGGVQGPVATGSSAASRQFAAALFVQEWAQTLWGLVTIQTATGTPSFGEPVFNPDGSVTLTFTFANGATQTVIQSVPEFDGVSTTTTHYTITSSDGLSVAYTTVVDDRGSPDASDDTTQGDGSATLADGATQSFAWTSVPGQTDLRATQSDGSTFAMTVPMRPPDYIVPDFDVSRPATGVYTIGGVSLRFTLSSTTQVPSRWASMICDLGDGTTGQFSLNPDFSGSGALTQGGQTVALLSWTREGRTQVSLLTGERSSAAPAGAALDYIIHQWQTLVALLGPAPGVSGSASGARTHRMGMSTHR